MNKDEREDYYVYVYIDPRNFQEFYYGKGSGTRKDAHKLDRSDSEKVKRIRAIERDGLTPIIKVIAANLTQDQALLVENTLIWKLRHQLTNISGGNFSSHFRPVNTLHRNEHGFDFNRRVYLVNVGECGYRAWEDCHRYGFLSAGGGKKFSQQLKGINIGDAVVAHLAGCGYVGVGVVIADSVPVSSFRTNGKPLSKLSLKCGEMFHHSDDEILCEHLIGVKWKVKKLAEEAIWERKYGLFSTRLIKASLENQQKTITFIEKRWGVDFAALIA